MWIKKKVLRYVALSMGNHWKNVEFDGFSHSKPPKFPSFVKYSGQDFQNVYARFQKNSSYASRGLSVILVLTYLFLCYLSVSVWCLFVCTSISISIICVSQENLALLHLTIRCMTSMYDLISVNYSFNEIKRAAGST